MQKANKAPVWDLCCSCRPQAPSRTAEGDPHWAPSRVSLRSPGRKVKSEVQGISLKRKRKRKENGRMTWETKLRWARPVSLFSEGAFIPWVIHWAKWKMQSQLNIPSVVAFIDTRFLPAYHFINKGLIFCTLSSGPEACWHFMTHFW